MKTVPLGLLLALVLLAHWAGLSWLRLTLQDLKPLRPMADPLFTRVIEQVLASPPVPVNRPRSRPWPAGRPAASALAAVVVPQTQTPPAAAAETGAPEQPAPAQPPELAQQPPPEAAAVEPQQQAAPAGPPAPVQAPPAPDGWPADTRVSYRLTGYYRGDLFGNGRVQWQREQGRYQVRVDLSLALVVQVSMISQGEVSDAALLPRLYEERVPAGQRRVLIEGGMVRTHDGRQLPQPPAVQDTASQFVELSHRFSTGRAALQTGAQVSLWLARPMGVDLWTYDVVGEETLQTPELGPVQAFHLRPRPLANPRGVVSAEMWFAPSLQYLPVRVRIALGDLNFVDLMVERIEQGAAPAPPAPPAPPTPTPTPGATTVP